MARASEGLVAADSVSCICLRGRCPVGWHSKMRAMPSAFVGKPHPLSFPFPSSVRDRTGGSEPPMPQALLGSWQELEELEAGVQLIRSWVRKARGALLHGSASSPPCALPGTR